VADAVIDTDRGSACDGPRESGSLTLREARWAGAEGGNRGSRRGGLRRADRLVHDSAEVRGPIPPIDRRGAIRPSDADHIETGTEQILPVRIGAGSSRIRIAGIQPLIERILRVRIAARDVFAPRAVGISESREPAGRTAAEAVGMAGVVFRRHIVASSA